MINLGKIRMNEWFHIHTPMCTGQRRSLFADNSHDCGPSLTSCLKQHNSLHLPYTPPPFLLISSGRRSTRYVWSSREKWGSGTVWISSPIANFLIVEGIFIAVQQRRQPKLTDFSRFCRILRICNHFKICSPIRTLDFFTKWRIFW